MANPDYQPLALMVHPPRVDGPSYPGDDRARWTAEVELVTVEDGSPRNINEGGSRFNGTHGMGGFKVRASMPQSWVKDGMGGANWGITIGAERGGFKLNIDDAIATGKFAASVQRKLDKMDAEFGRPTTFGEYVLRVKTATGAKSIVWPDGGVMPGTYTDVTWTVMSTTEVLATLNGSLRDFIDRFSAVPA